MRQFRRPKAFISYRHAERRGDGAAEEYNHKHRDWVLRFAEALATWNVDVIHDGRLREMLRPLTVKDPNEVPFVGEVSLLCMHVSQAFLPIITQGYLERVTGLGNGSEPVYGTVTEEWSMAMALYAAGRIEFAPIIREWPIGTLDVPPAPITESNSWDFRFVDAERDEVELIGDKLQTGYDVERPPIDLLFADWIKLYLKWSMLLQELEPKARQQLGPALLKVILETRNDPPQWPLIDDWDCDFDRPKQFLSYCADLRDRGVLVETGPQRDLDELHRNLADMGAQVEYVSQPEPPLDPQAEAKINEQIGEFHSHMQNFARAQVMTYRPPIQFSGPHPEEALQGLCFGATNLDYSHRHPIDIEEIRQTTSQSKGFWRRLFGGD
ncbi:MAG: hypothetical protein KJ587_11660 [Alphaproteobacteria bacterium]|nr:hypothetical protein [Alphaproteobacteria bacterium]